MIYELDIAYAFNHYFSYYKNYWEEQKCFKGIEFLPQTSNFNTIATQCRRSLIFQTMNAIRSNNVSLKYQRLTPLGCKDIGFTKTEFVAKTQFLLMFLTVILYLPPLLLYNPPPGKKCPLALCSWKVNSHTSVTRNF